MPHLQKCQSGGGACGPDVSREVGAPSELEAKANEN